MGPPAAPCQGSLTPAVLLFLLLLFLLASGATEGCLHCGHQFKNLKMRFAHLCARYRERFGRGNCSKYPWGAKAVRDFALDEAALDLLLEKAHRVLRVMEIKQSFADLPKFWNWLHEVKMPSETREALCPPACHVMASVFNCSTCRRAEIRCWDMRTCYPEYQGLPKIIQLFLYISGSCFFLGLVSCAVDSLSGDPTTFPTENTGSPKTWVSFPSWSWKKIEDKENIRNLFYVLGHACSKCARGKRRGRARTQPAP